MTGDVEAIDKAITALKENRLVLKIMKELHDYLSCKVKFSTNKKRAWWGWPHFIKNPVKKFGNCVKHNWNHKTSGFPKFFIVMPMKQSEKTSAEDQNEYLSGVGMLLFLVNHSKQIFPMQPRSYQKPMMLQTLSLFKNCYMWLSMFWTWTISVWSWDQEGMSTNPGR